jgi:predicted secreted Zn-dependent protease
VSLMGSQAGFNQRHCGLTQLTNGVQLRRLRRSVSCSTVSGATCVRTYIPLQRWHAGERA